RPARPRVTVAGPTSRGSRRYRCRTFMPGGYGARARRQYRETTVFRLALAAADEEDHGDADQDGPGGGADYQRVDPAKPLADLFQRPAQVLLRAHPVGDGVDGARQVCAGLLDVGHQRVLIDGLGVGLRVRHLMLRSCRGAATRPVRDEGFIVSGPPRPLHHLAAWRALAASRTAGRGG